MRSVFRDGVVLGCTLDHAINELADRKPTSLAVSISPHRIGNSVESGPAVTPIYSLERGNRHACA